MPKATLAWRERSEGKTVPAAPALHHASNQGLKKEHDKLTERLRKASTLFLPHVQ